MRRSETPATDSGALTTRSGRTSVKPLAFYRGEKFVWTERRSRESLPGIAEVIRTEEMPPPPRKRTGNYRSGGGARRRRGGTAQPFDDYEDEDEEKELWEEEPGIRTATFMEWDEAEGKYYDQNVHEQGMPSKVCYLTYSTLTSCRSGIRRGRNTNGPNSWRAFQTG